MKREILYGSAALLIAAGALYWDVKEMDAASRPELIEHDEEMSDTKTRQWSSEEQRAHNDILSEKLRNHPGRKSRSAVSSPVSGKWVHRGPIGATGAFRFCEMDDGTDTIYAVTEGHYGGVQAILKGTIAFSAEDAAGDDMVMISQQFPQRWRDLHVYTVNGTKRLLGTVENGPVFYSDDMGKNWTRSGGLQDQMQNTIRNRQENDRLYSCDKQKVYVSDDGGTTFSVLQDFGSESAMRLHTPRYDSYSNAETVYLARNGKLWRLENGSFTSYGTFYSGINGIVDGESFAHALYQLQGDSRYLYAHFSEYNSSKNGKIQEPYFMVSTDNGVTWTRKRPRGAYYNEPNGTATSFSWMGVHPDTPSVAILGYAHPTISLDGGNSDMISKDEWGIYQGGHDTWDNQLYKLRNYYHPDFQGSQYFYDKEGKLFSVRSSDGGLLISRNEWIPGHYPGDYYNFTVKIPTGITETYKRGMVCGFQNVQDFALGTQDQGWQNPVGLEPGTDLVRVLSVGGDGSSFASGPDGEYGWELKNSQIRQPYTLYSNETFRGNTYRSGTTHNITVKDAWFDLKDYQNTIWILNSEITKVKYEWSFSQETKSFGNSGNVAAMCQSPANTSIYWVLDTNKVYKSTDGGSTFTQTATAPMAASTAGGDVRGWAFDDNTVLFAGKGTGGTSIISIDGGTTFTVVEGIPDGAEVRWMQGDKDGTIAMASTSKGPYLYDRNQNMWFDAAGSYEFGAPYFNGQWGAYNPTTNTFRFSTWGYGVWDFQVGETAEPDPYLTVTSPSSGESLETGSDLTIRWSSFVEQADSVHIALLESGSDISSIGSEAIEKGAFTWSLPSDLPAGSDYSVKVTAVLADSLGDISETFTITTPDSTHFVLDQSRLSIHSFDSEESGVDDAVNAIDGDPNTMWHTAWTSDLEMPHEIVIKADQSYRLTGLSYLARQSGDNGKIANYEIYVSSDGISWGDAVKTGTFENSTDEQVVEFPETEGEYVKLVALTSHNGNPFASAAEINLLYNAEEIAVATGNGVVSHANTLSLLGVSASQLRFSIPKAGTYTVKLHSLNGRVLFSKTVKLSAGSNTVLLPRNNIASQVGLVSIAGQGKRLTQKVAFTSF